jgi:Mn2+/Fe2+ NRAMP family transporter
MISKTDMEKTPQVPRISKPPLTIKSFVKYLGPAFIFTATQIGGGEFITVPLLGAYAGMAGLFLVPLIAFTKIFGQYYLVQYGVIRGKTFLQTCWDKKWLRWMFFLLMFGCILHSIMLAGLLGQTGYTFNYLFPISKEFWIIILIIGAFLIVVTKSYNLLEKVSSVLLWVFLTLITIVALLFWPTLEQWMIGIIPQLPGAIEGLETTSGAMTLAVLFVVLGAGFGPTVSYIWYAKDKKMGMFEATANGYEI